MFPDITARKRAEEEVRRLNLELEQRVIRRTAQLEAANKELGTRVLLSDSTRQLAGEAFPYRPLGEISIRGKSDPITIYTLDA